MAKKALQAVPQVDPDLSLINEDSSQIAQFLTGIVAFFTEARELEKDAEQALVMAKSLRAPTTGDEDRAMVLTAKGFTEQKKRALQHWSPRSLVFSLHKRLIDREKRTTGPLDAAFEIANTHHLTYATNERRRVAEEQERLRREAEAQAQRERDAEVARLEAELEAAEARAADLSAREADYVTYVMRYGDGIKAARLAGFKEPEKAHRRLSGSAKIQAALDAAKRAIVAREAAEAAKRAPLDVQPIADVQPDIVKADGAHDRTTRSAELFDEEALIRAIVLDMATRLTSGVSSGIMIPTELLQINRVKLNGYARSLPASVLARWPGVRLVEKTRIV